MKTLLVETKISYDRSHPNARDVNAMAGLTRTFIHRHTLAWGTDGVRALPVVMWDFFDKEVQSFKRDIHAKGGDLQVYYIPYPHIEESSGNQKIFNAQSLELKRRCDLMESDLLTRVGLMLSNLRDRVKPDFTDGAAKLRRFHEETISGLDYEVELYSQLNSVLKNNALENILVNASKLAKYDVKAIRKEAAIRQEVYQKTVELVNLLSNA